MKLISLILLALLLPIIPELFGSPDTFRDRAGIPSELFLIFAVFLFSLFRIAKGYTLSGHIKKLFLAIFIFSGILSILLTIIDFLTHTNFVYSTTKINYDKLLFLSLATGTLWFLSFSTQFLKKNAHAILFVVPIITMLIGLLMWTWPFEKMYLLTKEDSFVEYLQFFTLLLGSLFSFRLSKKLIKQSLVFAFLFFLFGLALFAVAGDEISWGQRIFGFITPSELSQMNTQQEITFHNIYSYEIYVTYGYILLGLYGSIISYGLTKILTFTSKMFFVIPKHLFFYFFFPLCIQSSLLVVTDNNLKGFPELSELLLYLGITVFIIELFYKQKAILLQKAPKKRR